MKTYTKEQKKEYFKNLREEWQKSKKMSENNKEMKAVIREAGLNCSLTSFAMVQNQMKVQKIDGIPYVDCKTFKNWKESGFKVKKGEKSTVKGIVWMNTSKDDEDDIYLYPKVYHLFHKKQVEEIE
jgi:hypothetical protein